MSAGIIVTEGQGTRPTSNPRPRKFHEGLLLALLLVSGCRRDMFQQPKETPLHASEFFPDGAASRPLPAHVISRDGHGLDGPYYSGLTGTNLVATFPFPVTREILERGRQRFEIDCSPCHGLAGEGNGVVVQRGFPTPPSYHIARLRKAPVGHFIDVMVRGYGAMYPQVERVGPEDRWAIAAYIRALQLSRHATLADAPATEARKLTATP